MDGRRTICGRRCAPWVGAVTAGHPLRGFVAELERRPGVSNLRLDRFGRADAVALLTAVLGTTPDPGLTEAIFQRSEGNPFFVVSFNFDKRDI